jgi:hypothetical protein
MGPISKAYNIFRYLGPRVVWLRAGVYIGKALGLTRRRFPHTPWNTIDLATICRPGTPADAADYAAYKTANAPSFLFPLGRPPRINTSPAQAANGRQPDLPERLALLARDKCVYFFRKPSPEPIDWYHNPFDDMRSDPDRPWHEIPDYLPTQGDPRMLWEPARAAWALDFARAGPHGHDTAAGELYWRWVDSWMNACPPFMGFHWKCGQESSVRFIAIALAFWALANDPATTPERWTQFARLAWATGHRVINQINYAVSQKNNHAMSEACGLLLISHLFPEFRESAAWFEKGHSVLLEELRRQVYADGTYLQQSMNYERVMLDGSILGARIAELAGRPMPQDFRDTLGRCARFLCQTMDPGTGQVPQYGPNDGAHVLPLTECDFTDFRPVIQAAHYAATGECLLPSGPWDEELLWLFGEQALQTGSAAPPKLESRSFDSGGYYTFRGAASWAMIRCHTYRDRPTQCDPLQLDLWWRGLNIFRDCGTYHYYCPGRQDLEYYFKSIVAHNTIEIDGRDPLELVSRFLWFPWPKAMSIQHKAIDQHIQCFEGVSFAYDRRPWSVRHRRLVLAVAGDSWVVLDELSGRGDHTAVLRWHMLDAPSEVDPAAQTVRLHTNEGPLCISLAADSGPVDEIQVIRARTEPGNVQGIASPYYGEILPAPTLEASHAFSTSLRLLTVVSPGKPAALHIAEPRPDRTVWCISTAAGTLSVTLRSAPPGSTILVDCEFDPKAVNL